jgi:hypothetical protein
MRKQVPPEKTKDVVEFATKRPDQRLGSIRQGIDVGCCLIPVKIHMTRHYRCLLLVNPSMSANSA